MLRVVTALIGLALVFGAMTQVVAPAPAATVSDCDAPSREDALPPQSELVAPEPVRLVITAVWDREVLTGRLAIFAPFRPPRSSAT